MIPILVVLVGVDRPLLAVLITLTKYHIEFFHCFPTIPCTVPDDYPVRLECDSRLTGAGRFMVMFPKIVQRDYIDYHRLKIY